MNLFAKLSFFVTLLIVLLSTTVQAQVTTARNFERKDCSGNAHNLFNELDSGDLVVMEYIMTCSACSNAEHKVETMLKPYFAKHPNRIRFYQFAYTNSYDCSEMQNFISANEMHTVAFDSGASDVAYYGGFGMPTFVILGGKDHRVLYTGIGFSTSDTLDMSLAVQQFFTETSVANDEPSLQELNISPFPIRSSFELSGLSLTQSTSSVRISTLNGQELHCWTQLNTEMGRCRLDLSPLQLNTGYYLIAVECGDKRTSRLVLVEH